MSGFVGLIICMMASAIGNAVLVEISINIVFSAVEHKYILLVFWHMFYNNWSIAFNES